MTVAQTVDGVLAQWGERLFYPSNRIVKTPPTPWLDTLTRRKAAVIRGRIVATVVRRARQVVVKVTGGGRGMNAVAAHADSGTSSGSPVGGRDDSATDTDGTSCSSASDLAIGAFNGASASWLLSDEQV